MNRFRRWGGRCAIGAVAGVVAACGSSEESSEHPDAGGNDAAAEAAHAGDGGAGFGGSSGAGGTAGANPGGTAGAGCTLGDAGPDIPSPLPDASLTMDVTDGGARDASVRDATVAPPKDASTREAGGVKDAGTGGASSGKDAAVDAGAGTDSGSGPVTYPPLQFSKIGKAQVISDQFLFTEGPVWDPASQALFFADINADVVYRLTLPDTLDVAINHAGNPDGLALDPDGNLIAAGFVSRDIWRYDGKKIHSIASSYRERKLNSPDDLTARSDGTIYFTDPTFGIDGSQGFTAQAPELCFQGVYRLTTDGRIHLEDQTTGGPNGVNFSPDEKTLYVSYTGAGEVDSFAVAPDGSLHDKTFFATVFVADSMCVDAGGNVYVASFNGITVLDPNAKQLGVIPTNGQVPTNCAFGGPDQRTFFITARTGLVGAPAKGNSSLLRIDDMPVPGTPGRP